MSGREFTIKTWGAEYWENPGSWSQKLKQDPAECHFSVPDGYWVVEAVSGECITHKVIGRAAQIERIMLDDQSRFSTIYLYVSSHPIAVASYYIDDPNGGKRLSCARQIRRGELGEVGPAVARLYSVREPEMLGSGTRNRRRNFRRWVNLNDLLEASGLEAVDALLGYVPFVDSHYENRFSSREPMFPLIQSYNLVSDFEDNRFDRHDLEGIPLSEVHRELRTGLFVPSFWWIRQGTAKTILRLQALGLEPYQRVIDACIPPSRFI